jgi:hypothetical protein
MRGEAERRQGRRDAGLKAEHTKGPQRRKAAAAKAVETKGRLGLQEAGFKAAETKGPEERRREALMARWTRKHGKNDAENPYSKQNYRGG